MVSGLTGYKEYRLSVVGVNYSGNAYNSTEITAWTEEGGTCNIPKYVVVAFLGGGGGSYISCITGACKQTLTLVTRELKQQRRRRLRKRQLKCVRAA